MTADLLHFWWDNLYTFEAQEEKLHFSTGHHSTTTIPVYTIITTEVSLESSIRTTANLSKFYTQ